MPVRKRLLQVTLLGVLCVMSVGWAPPGSSTAYADDDVASTRDEILSSRRWRQLRRRFDQWLSVQKIYTKEQVAEIKSRLDAKIDAMTVIELEDFMYDSEERLDVLMSQDAESARDWLSVLTMEGRQRMLPKTDGADVFDMTVAQLRQELRRFQEMRQRRAAAQQQFNRSQNQRANALLQDRKAQDRAREQANLQARQRAADNAARQQAQPAVRGPYSPRQDPSFMDRNRSMYITPWGGVGFRFDL